MSSPQFGPRRHRALDRILTWQRAAPWRARYWQAVDAMRAQHAQDWPRSCYLPIEAAGAIVVDAWRQAGRQPTPATIVQEVSELATYAAWRVTQGVYRYDQTLAQALVETTLQGALPAAALTRLPEWCVYVETPGRHVETTSGRTPLHGYYAWIDHAAESEQDVLTLGLDAAMPLTITHVPLVGTLEQAIAAVTATWQDAYEVGNSARPPRPGYADAARETLPPLLSLLLYLCAEDADFGDHRPTRPRPTKTKQGWRLFPADAPTAWDVGVRIGAALRQVPPSEARPDGQATGTRARPRAHIRRAHWHSYWTGRRADEETREVRVKWLPPTTVNLLDPDTLAVTVHRVDE